MKKNLEHNLGNTEDRSLKDRRSRRRRKKRTQSKFLMLPHCKYSNLKTCFHILFCQHKNLALKGIRILILLKLSAECFGEGKFLNQPPSFFVQNLLCSKVISKLIEGFHP